MTYRFLTTRRDGAVEYLALNRPEVRNAFNEDVIAELTRWAAAAADAATFRGAGRVATGTGLAAGAGWPVAALDDADLVVALDATDRAAGVIKTLSCYRRLPRKTPSALKSIRGKIPGGLESA